jgi:hypothetical protein
MENVDATSRWFAWQRACLTRTLPALLPALILLFASPASAARFAVETFSVTASNADGTIDLQAASHPFSLDVQASVSGGGSSTHEGLQSIRISLPPGLVGAAPAIPQCAAITMERSSCPGSAQVGVLRGKGPGIGQVEVPVYNIVPGSGFAASFGVSIAGEAVIQRLALVGTGVDSAVSLQSEESPGLTLTEIEEEIWGVPADPAHDPERVCWSTSDGTVEGCSSDAERVPLLTLPASCRAPLLTELSATSVGPPRVTATAAATSLDAFGNASPLSGCERVPFEPRLTEQSDSSALAPSAFNVNVELPQYAGAETTATAFVASLRVALPEGLTLNASAGAGLSGCSPAAIGLESASGSQPPHLDEDPTDCPLSSRLGTVKLATPLIDHELDGSIYLATPMANPFATRYAFYLVVEDEASGAVLKVPGRLDADAVDGRLTATIPELPPFPFSKLELEFSGGPRAPLVSPASCGRYTGDATFTPSTAPYDFPVMRSASLTFSSDVGGEPCPSPEAESNATPSFQAGTEVPVAGGGSSLAVRLSREDTDQHLSSFALTLPPGLIANLGSVPLGAPIGSVQAKVGVGPEPLAVDGAVYLEGPYRGAPFSLEAVVPAKAGPFDLGSITERATIDVNPATAQVSVAADPLPQIVDGVPVQLRSFAIDLDRSGFIRNPTSCEPMAITATATSSLNQVTPLSIPFQVGNCTGLPFKPKLSLGLSGIPYRGAHPGVRVTLRQRLGDANLSEATLTLPPTELLDNRHVKAVCPTDRFALGDCPKGSLVGRAKVWTALLGRLLEGNIYLRSSAGLLPVLATSLEGEVHMTLVAKINSVHRRLRFHLAGIPDVPLEKVTLDLFGGKRGVIVDSGGLCSGNPRAEAFFTAQSGRTEAVRPWVASGCASASHRGQ